MELRNKRKLFWILTILAPIAFIVALEGVLRWVKFGDNLDFVFVQEYNGKQYYTVNRSLAQRYFPRHSIRPPGVYDGTFEVIKSAGTYRIFLLGESTMQGFPYEYNGALHRLLEDRLLNLFPGRKIEIINLGITAVNSYAVLDLMREVVCYEPDLIIVYLGHNEFYGSFGTASIEFMGKNRSLINWYLRLEHFKIVQALQRMIGAVYSVDNNDGMKMPSAGFMQLLAKEKTIPYGSDLYAATKENFEENLNDIADVAAAHHVPLMLSTVVSNLHDRPPFISDFSKDIDTETRNRWSELVQKGKNEQDRGKYKEALELYDEALHIDTMRADIHYDMGVCFYALQNIPDAKRQFILAKDFDLLRFRATNDFNAVVQNIVEKKHLMLADIAKAFDEHSEHGIVGRSLMVEHVHPNLDGYFLIAKEYARAMKQHNCITSDSLWRLPLPDDDYKALSLMTLFDFEVSFLRIDNLLHHWPFSEPESTMYYPTSSEGKLAEEYLRGKIDWEHAHYRLAEQYKSQKRFPDAVREYLAIAKVLGFDFNPLALAGDVDLTMKNYREAEAIYRMAMNRENNQFVKVRLGELFSETGVPDSAIYYYRGALVQDAHSEVKLKQEWKLELMEHLAEEYFRKGDLPRAREQLMNVLSVNRNSPTAQHLLDTLNAVEGMVHSQ